MRPTVQFRVGLRDEAMVEEDRKVFEILDSLGRGCRVNVHWNGIGCCEQCGNMVRIDSKEECPWYTVWVVLET